MKRIINMIVTMILIIMVMTTFNACAQGKNHAKLIITSGFENVILKNAEGKSLTFVKAAEDEDENEIKGDMTIFNRDFYLEEGDDGEDHADQGLYEIPDSDYYSLESIEEDGVMKQQVAFILQNKYNESIAFITEYIKKIEIDKGKVIIFGDEDSTFEYSINYLMTLGKKKIYYYISGANIGKIKAEAKNGGINTYGVKGKTVVSAEYEGAYDSIDFGNYYFFGSRNRICVRKGKMIVTSAPRIPERETKRVTSLYLRPANDGKNMFLTWNKVKKAKSYIVYKYDYTKRQHKRVAVRGKNANYLNIGHAVPNEKYRYKVAAMSKAKGKGKKVCKRSYPVWAVAQENTYGNASKVTTSMPEIKGKAGKAYRLKAAISSKEGKTLLSDNIRWYCSNHKVATVDKKTGKVKLKKKGKCRIWAKAHNGKNSRQVKVVVK